LAGKAGSAADKLSPEVREILADPVMKETLSRISTDAAAAKAALADPDIERKLRTLVAAGVLQPKGAGGNPVAWPPPRGAAANPSAKQANEDPDASVKAAIAQLLPSQEEIAKLASQTDTDQFMADLSSMAGMLGLGEEAGGCSSCGREAVSSAPLEIDQAQVLVRGLEQVSQRAESDSLAAAQQLRSFSEHLGMAPPNKAAPPNGSAAAEAARREPDCELEDDGLGGVVLRVHLPGVASMDGVQLDVSDDCCDLRMADGGTLRRPWPRTLDSSRASAKFSKRGAVLVVRCPARSGIVV
jgi:hypothetical protein